MNNKTFVRTLLIDSENKQYIKKLDERSLDSYIELLSKENKNDIANHLTIVDFSPVIEHLHQGIESALKKHRNEQIKIHHATTYNIWLRFKDIPEHNENIILSQAMKIMDDTELTFNTIISSLGELNAKYIRLQLTQTIESDKNNLLEEILDNADIFIESMLCHIHAGIILNPDILKKSVTIPQHLLSVLKTLQGLLRDEAGVHPNLTLHWDNIIEQGCMEPIGVDPELMINLTNANTSVELIRQKIFSQPIEDAYNQGNNNAHRMMILRWNKASHYKITRAKLLCEKIKKILSLLDLMEKIRSAEYNFSRSSTDMADVENEIRALTNIQ